MLLLLRGRQMSEGLLQRNGGVALMTGGVRLMMMSVTEEEGQKMLDL